MNIQEASKLLSNVFVDKQWFHSSIVYNNRLVVCAKYMSREVFESVPDEFNSFQVLLHFSNFYTSEKDKFVGRQYNLDNIQELKTKLSKNKLRDMLFEIQDGDDCVTNFKTEYPQDYEVLKLLVKNFGFARVYYVIGEK